MVVTSNPSPIPSAGTNVELICTVELGPTVSQSDLSLLMVDAQLSRDGTPLALTGPTMTGTTFNYTIQLDSFGRNDSGDYTCTATVKPQLTSTYLTESGTKYSNTVRITAGVSIVMDIEVYILLMYACSLI